MRKITAIVTCGNEARHIEAVLRSLSWCDEVVVVDSFSSDGTVDIARQHATKVLQRAYKNPADQKNWAIPQAMHEWIILLDADERVRPELRAEIQGLLAEEHIPHDAYRIHRNNYFMGKRIRFSGWQRDTVVRFFNRDNCHYPNQYVHEELTTTGTIGDLKGRLDHYTYTNTDHFMEKIQRYAAWSAIDKDSKTGKLTLFHFWIKPAFRFFRHYIIDLGILDGRAGYTISRMNAYGVYLRYVHMKKNRMGKPTA
jgi:glycosyltransferase involved in cell wall biosynthesis